ncbi:hypothetical protein D9M71_494290 [compost metagenome]
MTQLVGMLAREGGHRAGKNDEVEPQRPVVDVFDVRIDPTDHLLDILGFTPVAAHLGQARDAGLDVVARKVVGDVG